ncbi:TIGR03085 family metal-binding protein [soil metagenome]
MPLSLARRERHELCDLAVLLGADAPTLCGDWTAKQLLAHLFVREHRPLSAAGLLVPGLGGITDRSMTRAERTDHGVLAETMREPGLSPFALKPVEVLANTLEYVVHHEDLRRAQPGWEPRSLSEGDLDTIWKAIGRMGRLLVRPAGVPVVIRRSDTGATSTLRGGEDPVTIDGPVVEVVLYLFGRSEVRDVSLEGPDEAVERVELADLGL